MKRFSLTAATRALFDFSTRTLEDFSGYGLDLYGTHSFREVAPQVFELAPGSDVARPARDPELALTGPITVEVTGRMYAAPGILTFVAFLATGETLATNVQWLLGTQDAGRLRWLQEHGTGGTDAPALPLAALVSNEALPAPGADFHVAGVRYSDGSVALFLNGRMCARSGPLTAPAGGTSALLRVMMGATAFGLQGVRISDAALTPAEIAESYQHVLGEDYGAPNVSGKLSVGALAHDRATVLARMAAPCTVALTVNGDQTAPVTTDSDNVARFELTGLDPATEYTFALPSGIDGRFRTLPAAAGDPASFTIAFGGDQDSGSTSKIFDTIQGFDPDLYLQIGDEGYFNTTTNSAASFHANYDTNQASPPQHRLGRRVPRVKVWDDHDGAGGNNADGSAAAWPAAAAVYRVREPSYALPHSRAIYHTFDVGRVRFIVTDQRSEASPGTMTDGPSKTMLGATQKAWFKDLVQNSPGMLLVWVCPRWFANANHVDSWNSYATERAELCDWIKLYALGRLVVLEADQHTLAIDDGSHVDHATGGGGPIRCFRAAPLDRAVSALAGTYSHGEFNGNGQFGLMQVVDEDVNDPIEVTWSGYDSAGQLLTTYTFQVAL